MKCYRDLQQAVLSMDNMHTKVRVTEFMLSVQERKFDAYATRYMDNFVHLAATAAVATAVVAAAGGALLVVVASTMTFLT